MMSTKKYDVVGLGGCGIDFRLDVPKLPNIDEKVVASNLEVSEGGVTANNLVQCGRLPLKSAWVGLLGEDQWASHLIQKFTEAGVDVPNPSLEPDRASSQFWIIADRAGQTTMIGYPGALKNLTPQIVRKKFGKIIESCKHFHVEISSALSLSPLVEGARIAKDSGAKVIVDVDSDPFYLIEKEKIGTKKELRELFSMADVLKFSRGAACGYAKVSKIDERVVSLIASDFSKNFSKIVVVTLADGGCIAWSREGIIKVPGFKVKVVDPVGAGDAFLGGLSYALLKDFKIERALKLANACGAFKCGRKGARSSGTLREIEKFFSLTF